MWLVAVVVASGLVRAVSSDRLAHDGVVSCDALWRLHVADLGMLLIAMAVVILVVGARFGTALDAVTRATERRDVDDSERLRQLGQREGHADLVYRLADRLARRARTMHDAPGARGIGLDAQRLVDVLAPVQPGYSLATGKFSIRGVLARVEASPMPDNVVVWTATANGVGDLVRGDGELLARTLGGLARMVAVEPDTRTVLVTANATPAGAMMLLEFEVRDASIAPRRGELDPSEAPSDDVLAISAMATALGGELRWRRRPDEPARFVLTAPVFTYDASEDSQVHAAAPIVSVGEDIGSGAALLLDRPIPVPPSDPTSGKHPTVPVPLAARPRKATVRVIEETADFPSLKDIARAKPTVDSQRLEVGVSFSRSGSKSAPLFAPPSANDIPATERAERTPGSTPVAAYERRARPAVGGDLRSSARLLVVESDADQRWRLAERLTARGFAVDAVSDGATAQDAVQARVYATVILATELADMNGFQLATRLRGWSRTSFLPIVAVSSFDAPEERARCAAAGIDELVLRPIDTDALAHLVVRLARAEFARSSESGRIPLPEDASSAVREVVGQSLEAFIERTERAFQAFELGFEESDSTLVRVTADQLRRSCSEAGATEMADISRRVAEAAREDIAVARPLVADLHAEFERVRPAFSAAPQ